MITPAEALALIMDTVQPGAPVSLPLKHAVGSFLAFSIAAPISLPLFDNSAMDGYALRAEDTAGASEGVPVQLPVAGIIAAGDDAVDAAEGMMQDCSAVQIFTGAMMPPWADAVVRQEDVVRSDNPSRITINAPVPAGANVRRAGEEIRAGDIILKAGDKLTPSAIGLLASLGISGVDVVKKPRVGCVVTGSELRPPGTELLPGQIYNSNSAMLAAATDQAGFVLSFQRQCGDDLNTLTATLREALYESDVLLVTGGVSVGAYDYVRTAAERVGVQEIFWKIAQKPGKPIYFGATPDRSKFLFGLPGNPASVLTCFYEYVRPALRCIMGANDCAPVTVPALLASSYAKRGTLTQFLKGCLSNDGTLTILEKQGSHMLSSFAQSNCLAVIPAEVSELQKGDQVQVHLLAE